MKQQIAAGEFKAKCLHILDEVQRSRKEVVITKRGKPVARLVPTEDKPPSIIGRMQGTGRIVGDIISPVELKWNAMEDE